MYDIHVMLPDNSGTLGQFGILMGRAGVSLEGGGMLAKLGHPPDGKWWIAQIGIPT